MTTELKVAKANYRLALKNKERYEKKRNDLVMQIIESDIPDWGSIKITVGKI